MKCYEFTIKAVGWGDDEESAWVDCREFIDTIEPEGVVIEDRSDSDAYQPNDKDGSITAEECIPVECGDYTTTEGATT